MHILSGPCTDVAASEAASNGLGAEGPTDSGTTAGLVSTAGLGSTPAFSAPPLKDEGASSAGLGLGGSAVLGASAGLGSDSGGGLGFSSGGLVPEHAEGGSDGEGQEAEQSAAVRPGLGNFAAAGTMDSADAGLQGSLQGPPWQATPVAIKQEVSCIPSQKQPALYKVDPPDFPIARVQNCSGRTVIWLRLHRRCRRKRRMMTSSASSSALRQQSR